MTADLPAELWLIILSLLPPHYLRKMMSISRILFEIALDDMYNELQIVSDDQQMVHTLDQLRHPNIGRRVRHIYIRPDFFPGAEEHARLERFTAREASKTLLCLPVGCLAWIPHAPPPLLEAIKRSTIILEVAQVAITQCSHVENVTIVLRDLIEAPIPSFAPFLQSMWSSLGPRIRRLTVHATLAKL